MDGRRLIWDPQSEEYYTAAEVKRILVYYQSRCLERGIPPLAGTTKDVDPKNISEIVEEARIFSGTSVM